MPDESDTNHRTDYMSDLHMVIIDDVSKMISWRAIGFDQYWIFIRRFPVLEKYGVLFVPADRAIHKVIVLWIYIRDLETDDIRFTSESSVLRFCFWQAFAGSVIICRQSKLTSLLCKLVQAI